ncbi:MAG: GNAT family N-acetyltransferase [Bacteroidales bacterium]|nr:GNAT family N-acetyltransferase [Bacteroidales bacterium]
MEIFEQAKGIMRSDGNFGQWTGGYPSVEVLKADMERGSSYVISDSGSEIVGTFAFIPGIEPTYNYIEGKWLTDGPYATIHRLASGPESHGIARECFDWCWSRVQNLRIDTHADNSIMQHCILKYGFTYCGVIYLANGDPRLAYQKI